MKLDSPFRPVNALLAALIAISGTFCLATGFRLDTAWLQIGLLITAFSLLCQLSLSFKGGSVVFILVCAAACGAVAKKLLLSVQYLLHIISRFYDGGYGWGILALSLIHI